MTKFVILGIVLLVAYFLLLNFYFRKEAQRAAIKARDSAMALYWTNPKQNAALGMRILRLGNPRVKGLTRVQYVVLQQLWNELADDIVPAYDATSINSPRHRFHGGNRSL